jgi:biofilm PGA synthesis protein PgaD
MDWVLSAAMWLLYLYFIREALVDVYYLAEDSLQWALAGAERPELPTIRRFLDTMENYGIVVLANGGALITWALYNQIRFRGRDRHRPGESVSATDLSELYGIPVEEIVAWQGSRILEMHHDDAGTLVKVVPKDPGKLQPIGDQGPTVASPWTEQTA